MSWMVASLGGYSFISGKSMRPSSKIWSLVYRSLSSLSGWVGEIAQSKAGKNMMPVFLVLTPLHPRSNVVENSASGLY